MGREQEVKQPAITKNSPDVLAGAGHARHLDIGVILKRGEAAAYDLELLTEESQGREAEPAE